jgi:hypothetical protein
MSMKECMPLKPMLKAIQLEHDETYDIMPPSDLTSVGGYYN